MRRKDLEVTDRQALIKLVARCRVLRLGLADEKGIYIVPVNFGYEVKDDILWLFFHSAKEGRKASLLKDKAVIDFEMDCDHELIPSSSLCAFSYRYRCAMGQGCLKEILDCNEKAHAMRSFMLHQTAMESEFQKEQLSGCAVYRMEVIHLTGKSNGYAD